MIEDIRAVMEKEGIDVFGTSDCSAVVPDRFRRTPFAITLGIRLSDAVVDDIAKGPTKMYFAHYRSVNALLDACALAQCYNAAARGTQGACRACFANGEHCSNSR